ncbi:MAG: TldD/PmbA family protein [Candidatus Hermodarchaeia archaeon]
MTTDLISLIQPFVKDGIQKGADEVEVFAQKEAKNTVNIEANALKSADISKLQGVGIRVLVKSALGFASVSSLDPAKIETTLRDAISIAKSTPADEHNQLPSPKKLVKVKGVYDEAIEELSIEQALQHGSHLLDSVSKIDHRISTYMGGFVTRISEKAIATSNDIQASEKKTICYYYLAGMAIDGSDIGVFDIDGDVIVKVDDIDIEKISQRFATKVLGNLGAEKTDSFEGPAILSPYAVEVLFQTLIHSSYASAIQAGQSFLQNRLGDQLASPNLTIEDNGILPNSYASSMFDREGNPHCPIKILDSGKYTGSLHTTFTARKDKIESTGHAIGTFRETPTIGPTNLKIHKGTQSMEQLIAEINHGLLIQRIDVFPDPISGDFSASLKGAKLIKNGELTTTLKEITATGNLYESLHHITGIENTLHPGFSENTYITNLTQHWQVPHIRIENLKFTA